ncbi:MAG: hypothetical protein ACO1OX_11650 [Novosphingobium sp.]
MACEIAPTDQIFGISDEYITYIDDGRDYYNTVVVIGSDPVRIRKFMRIYRPLLTNKAKVVLLSATRPHGLAQMLNIGFDDVIEAEMPPAEALARIRAILGRIALAQQSQALDAAADLHLQHYAAQALLGREARLLSMLVAAKGSPVRTQHLAASSKSTSRPIGLKSLQVLISGLRGKLKPHLQIVSHGPSGYALVDASPARRLIMEAKERTPAH